MEALAARGPELTPNFRACGIFCLATLCREAYQNDRVFSSVNTTRLCEWFWGCRIMLQAMFFVLSADSCLDMYLKVLYRTTQLAAAVPRKVLDKITVYSMSLSWSVRSWHRITTSTPYCEHRSCGAAQRLGWRGKVLHPVDLL